jgi:transposase
LVGEVSSRAKRAELSWPLPDDLGDDALSMKLYGVSKAGAPRHAVPDFARVHTELRRVGVTLELLHLEYLEANPGGYRRSRYCALYREWLKRQAPTMRQTHRAGERIFVDYAGKRPEIVDPLTGRIIDVELFVAVLGASNFAYADATRSQQVDDFIASHVRMFAAFGGVAAMLVPDQLRSAVTGPSSYEPAIQRSYQDMAEHYGTSVVPARPAHPRDKAKVENAVLQTERWVLARLRNQIFFSLDELNERVRDLVAELNARTMKTYGASRRDLFERVDRPALRPLPDRSYELARWTHAMVSLDYHVLVDHHAYSVPHCHVKDRVDVRATTTTIEVLLRGTRIASHVRSHERGGHTTDLAHMPVSHRKHLAWTPVTLIAWAETIGPETRQMVAAILADRPHPEMGYRSCLGIRHLAKSYGAPRIEAACRRAFAAGGRSSRHIETILRSGLDRIELAISHWGA